jgi:hypothetical protein
MKYFGKKSLSSLLSVILHVSWYVVLALSIIGGVILVIIMFSVSFGDPVTSEIAKGNFNFSGTTNYQENVCGNIKNWPLIVKIIVFPYFAAVVALLLQIIKKSQHLFANFKNDIVFNKSNVAILSKISKLNIGFSILTVSFSSLLVSVFLFMLCEIIKNGTVLQEEHDFTV